MNAAQQEFLLRGVPNVVYATYTPVLRYRKEITSGVWHEPVYHPALGTQLHPLGCLHVCDLSTGVCQGNSTVVIWPCGGLLAVKLGDVTPSLPVEESLAAASLLLSYFHQGHNRHGYAAMQITNGFSRGWRSW